MYIDPLFPELEVPVLRTNTPLTPDPPALDVWIRTEPLVDVVLKPDTREARPPTVPEVVPACSTSSPPDPVSPDPTERYTAPPRPEVATPEPIITAPLLPELEVPELRTSMPLTPDAPAFAVWIRRFPLEEIDE